MAMDERIDRPETDQPHRLGNREATESVHPTVEELPTGPEHRTERARPTGLLCRTGNLRQHQTGHQTFLLHRTGQALHRSAVEAVQWEEEVAHLEEVAEEGDKISTIAHRGRENNSHSKLAL